MKVGSADYLSGRCRGLNHSQMTTFLIRNKHWRRWISYKRIIAPDSQIHHEWISEMADFRGVALVETDQHAHGFVDVIQILEGQITLLTEAEIRGVIERNG